MRRTRVHRAAAVTFALTGALGLAACSDSAPKTESASGSQAEQSQAPETQSEQAPPTSSAAPESSAAPQSSASTSAATPKSDAKVAPDGTMLKIGKEGVINAGSRSTPEPIGVTPTGLEKAPDSVFSSNPSLKRANGAVYFLKHDVHNVNTSGAIQASDINGLFFHPKLNASNQGKAKRMYGSTAGCETNRDDIQPGQKASSCLIYQIGGDPVSDVVYQNSTSGTITWTK